MDYVTWFFSLMALVKLFVWLWAQFELPGKKTKPAGKPKLSAIIPAHNEERAIGKTVRSLLAAGMKPEDIYVLCNGCKDDTPGEVERCGVKPYIAPTRGKEPSINWGIHDSGALPPGKYDYHCFFDADTMAKKDYFKVIRERLQREPVDGLCGQPKSLPCNWLTAHRALQYWEFHWLHKQAQSRLGCILVVPGCAGVYSDKLMREIRWSGDTRIGDMDMTIEAVTRGKKIVFEPNAIVYTQDPNNMRDYTQQLYKRWNRGLWMNMRKHGILWKGWFSLLHWDCRMIFVDQFAIFLLPILWKIFAPDYSFWWGALFFAALIWLESIYFAFADKRWDVLKYMWIFPLLRVYDLMLFVGSVPSIMDLKEKSEAWASPTRY